MQDFFKINGENINKILCNNEKYKKLNKKTQQLENNLLKSREKQANLKINGENKRLNKNPQQLEKDLLESKEKQANFALKYIADYLSEELKEYRIFEGNITHTEIPILIQVYLIPKKLFKKKYNKMFNEMHDILDMKENEYRFFPIFFERNDIDKSYCHYVKIRKKLFVEYMQEINKKLEDIVFIEYEKMKFRPIIDNF